MVAGAHALGELPDEITTPGRGQIRAMVINCGNPVVSGPDGAKLDAALAQLDLLVAIDFVQRESHRHAHWLLPAVHWLERDDLTRVHQQHARRAVRAVRAKAVEPPPGARQEWRIFVDLAIAMRKPLFGAKGLNGFIKATRRWRGSRAGPASSSGRTGSTGWWWPPARKVNGRRIKWRDVMAHPHGWVLGPREFGHFRDALRTDDKKVHAAPPEFVARARELLAEPRPQAPAGYPFQLANRRNRHSMNSWLNELPGLHPSGKRNEVVIHPDDAADARHQRRRPGEGVLPRRARSNWRRRSASGRGGAWSSSTTAGAHGFSIHAAVRSRNPTAPTATC